MSVKISYFEISGKIKILLIHRTTRFALLSAILVLRIKRFPGVWHAELGAGAVWHGAGVSLARSEWIWSERSRSAAHGVDLERTEPVKGACAPAERAPNPRSERPTGGVSSKSTESVPN